MKRTLSGLVAAFSLSLATWLYAEGASPFQLFFVMKQAFPEQKEVAVFISKAQFAKLEGQITRAAAHNKVKAEVFIVESSSSIGSALRSMERNSVLILFESDLLLDNTTKLYILSKCKEQQIAIITESKAYSDSGALISVIKDPNDKLMLILNLKQNEHLKDVFTQELIAKVGFHDIIL